MVLVQLMTQQALVLFNPFVNSQPGDSIEYGLFLDDAFRVNHSTCRFFSSAAARDKVKELLTWFGGKYFPNPVQCELPFETEHSLSEDVNFAKTLALHRGYKHDSEFRYGWKDGGYTIVTHRNAPTNSLPILWYPMCDSRWASGPPLRYTPPFPRLHSRWSQTRMEDEQRLNSIRDNLSAIRRMLNE
jgi:hypothetical protein